jgi:hypothetical protein
MRDPERPAFILPNGEKYDNPRGLPQEWLLAFIHRDHDQLAIDLLRAWDKSHSTDRRVKRWIRIFTLVQAMLTVFLMVAKFFR